MSTLVIIEHDNTHAAVANRAVVTAALAFGSKPVAVVLGSNCAQVVKEVSSYQGIESVIVCDDPVYAHALAEPLAEGLKEISTEFTNILAPASTFGKNLLPRLAALFDSVQVSDVTNIIDHQTFEHPIYAGNAMECVQVLESKKFVTIRTTAFDACPLSDDVCQSTAHSVRSSWDKTKYLSLEKSESERPELNSADIVVSGGRGLQDAERFALVEELADTIGAAVGASRAAVDAGFVPNDYQVGQTGKIVAPSLYIALGISGAIQHLAGMKDSKIIVAINKDEDAPIFQIASYGLVGDVFDVVPKLIEQIKERRAQA